MSPSVSELANGQPPSTTDLPYGPLPVRSGHPSTSRTTTSQSDSLFRLSRPEPDLLASAGSKDPGSGEAAPETASPSPQGQAPELADDETDQSTAEHSPQPSSEVDVAAVTGDSDDNVHFGVAAKALGVSRKTVERMVKRGQLERGPSQAPATVSKRALVTVLEQRRQDGSHVTRATGLAPGQSGYASLVADWPEDATAQLQELLRPVLEPLLEDFIEARTKAALLESQMERLEARSAHEHARDELLLVLATGGWRERRNARKMALRQYVLRDDGRP
jgi:hypothetical protein